MRTPAEARRDGETALAKLGYVRGFGRDAATWTNNETGDVGRMAYVPGPDGSIAEIRFQRPPVDDILPAQTLLITF
jgi:hypothetical protein